jgi:hypothetical protein
LTSHHPPPTDQKGHVVPFRARGLPRWRWPVRPSGDSSPANDDLARYERTDGTDDYRHRMTMNALALCATILLVVIGIWIADTVTTMQKNQDCYLSGRRNCTPINVPPMIRN